MYYDLIQLADEVWLYPKDDNLEVDQPNVGAIILEHQTILIDAGNSPRHARRIMSSLATIGAAPIDYLIYTHHHWDHIFGGMVYSVPMIIAHQRCADILEDYAQQTWSATTLREEIYQNPALKGRNNAILSAINDWRGFRISLPTITIESNLSLYLDGVTLDICHVGGKHASDSIIVGIRERGIAFIGDCLYAPPVHSTEADQQTPIKSRVFKNLFDAGYDTFVEGHSKPLQGKDIQQALKGLITSDD